MSSSWSISKIDEAPEKAERAASGEGRSSQWAELSCSSTKKEGEVTEDEEKGEGSISVSEREREMSEREMSEREREMSEGVVGMPDDAERAGGGGAGVDSNDKSETVGKTRKLAASAPRGRSSSSLPVTRGRDDRKNHCPSPSSTVVCPPAQERILLTSSSLLPTNSILIPIRAPVSRSSLTSCEAIWGSRNAPWRSSRPRRASTRLAWRA